MANALDEVVETTEPKSDTPSSSAEEGSVVAPAPAPTPASDPVPEPAPKPSPAQTPEPAAAASAPKPAANGTSKNFVSTGIPIPERNTAPADAASHPAATLKNRFLIFPSMPLTDLDTPTASAYSVEDRREPGRHLYALICTPGLPTRTRTMVDLRNQTVRGLIPLVDYGPVHWSPLGQSCQVVIFERPMGGRLLDAFIDKPIKINEYDIGRRLFEPIAKALSELSSLDLPHRAVRIDNLYYMDKDRTELVLGECVTSPPGYDQPPIYEPLERAMAMPAGRGYGHTVDDIYALGVIGVFLLSGYNPAAKASNEELIMGKAELGTYQCLCGNERIPLPLIEPLRGMLSDDEKERWNTAAMDQWLSGQKKTPIQRRGVTKPKTSYKFAGRDHLTPRTIAYAFTKNVAEAAKTIKSGKLELWIRQSLGQPDIADGIASTMAMTKVHEGSPDGSDDVLVSKVCMRLDPQAPIRYKGLSFMPDGFGPALAIEYLRKGNFQIPGEILARDLLGFWFSSQSPITPDLTSMDRSFQALRNFAKINEVGFGLERCLYELNRSLPCQSPLLQQFYVDHIDEMLPALDAAIEHVDKRSRPIDKHVAAFIATHFKFDIQPHLKALSDPKEETSLIGMLSLFALMQWRLSKTPLYGLSSWLGGLLQPAIGTYHSRATRRAIEQEIPSLVRQGSLPDLFDLIDNAERRTKDNSDFQGAQIEFAHAESEIQSIIGEGVDQEKIALQTGERFTAIVGVVLGMISVTVIIFVKTM